MIHQDFPEIAQRAATHCDALLKRQSTPDDLALEFEQFGERAALALRPVVAQAWNDPAIQVRSCGIRTTAAGKLKDICGGLAAVSLHAFADERKLLHHGRLLFLGRRANRGGSVDAPFMDDSR